MLTRLTIVAAAVLFGAIAIACSDGGTETTVETSVARPVPTPDRTTGVPELDTLLRAAVANDFIELAGLTGYQRLACETEPPPDAFVPACREDESAGAEVEVFPTSACEPSWVRPEQVPDAYSRAFGGETATVVTAYVPSTPEGLLGGGFGAGQVVVLRTGTHEDGQPLGTALHVLEGRVVWLEQDCQNIVELFPAERVQSFILERPAGTPGDAPTAPPSDAPADGAPPDGAPAE
jgi:hypothetical protein